MERITGTVVRGLRAPIVKKGDNLAAIVTATVRRLYEQERVVPADRDVVAITESVVARAQGNYATVDDIAADIHAKFGNRPFGVLFPMLSRNRFAVCLRGIARGAALGAGKLWLQFSYPADEVGNHLVSYDQLDAEGINPWSDELSENAFRRHFGSVKHRFTGVDYIAYYKQIIAEANVDCELIFANRPSAILQYTDQVLHCDIHTRRRTRVQLLQNGARTVFGLDNILSEPTGDVGFNSEYGLLGSNTATDETVKLFPRDCGPLVNQIQADLKALTGRTIEVMVYGDGAFKDPVGQIWELADPVVSPGYTSGLEGTPNEVKIKYLADNNFADLTGENLRSAIADHIRHKNGNLAGSPESLGTTPRRLTDLLGSLADLTSGSGDKGTPIVYIQGYFDTFAE